MEALASVLNEIPDGLIGTVIVVWLFLRHLDKCKPEE